MTDTSSPLATASPDSLTELFNRDPLQMARVDRNEIVRELRAQRARYEAAELSGGPKPRAKSAAQASQVAQDLKALGLDD